MALLKAFKKQQEKKPCPVCGILVLNGVYWKHLKACKVDPSDEDCQVLAVLTAEDKKRLARERIINIDVTPERRHAQVSPADGGREEGSSSAKRPRMQVKDEDAMWSGSSRKRPHKVLSNEIENESKEAALAVVNGGEGGSQPRKRVDAIAMNDSLEDKSGKSDDSWLVLPSREIPRSSISKSEKSESMSYSMSLTCVHGLSKVRANSEVYKKVERKAEILRIADEDSGTRNAIVDVCDVEILETTETKSANPNEELKETKRKSKNFLVSTAANRQAEKKSDDLKTLKTVEDDITVLSSSKEFEKTGKVSDQSTEEDKTDENFSLSLPLVSKSKRSNFAVDRCSATSVCSSVSEFQEEPLSVIEHRIREYLSTCQCELSAASDASANDIGTSASADDPRSPVSPYYLVLFSRILKRVFSWDSPEGTVYSPSFWGEYLRYVDTFVSLTEGAKKLFIRILLRRRKWLIAEKLRYPDIGVPLIPFLVELEKADFLQSSASDLLDLGEALRLLQLGSLKTVAKQFKLDVNEGKNALCRSLLKASTHKSIFGSTCEKQMFKVVMKELGMCYRLRANVWKFFYAVFTVYSPTDMNSMNMIDNPTVNLASQFLFLLLQMSIRKVRYPAPECSPLISIFSDVDMLLRYIDAKEMEGEIATLMCAPQQAQWIEIEKLGEKARGAFHDGVNTYWDQYSLISPYLRRFTDVWVYTKCVMHGIEALQRLRKYDVAVVWLRDLLFTEHSELFATSSRGSLWVRLSLNLESHLKDKVEAMTAIRLGIDDPNIGDKDRLALQDRGAKLDWRWKGTLVVPDPERVDIVGKTLGKALGDSRVNHFVVDREGTRCESSVEIVAMDHYIKNFGYKEGVHAEGAVWHTVFGLLCYPIIFDYSIENVWLSESQLCPIDLNSREFYTNRKESFDRRFEEIEKSTTEELLASMRTVFDEHYGETNSEINWECFSDFEQISRFMVCCRPSVLVSVFRRVVLDYRNCRSGFPDLTLWNDTDHKLAVVEVKGPGDKLSTKQRLWLNYFKENGVTAHVCHVEARNPKRMGRDD